MCVSPQVWTDANLDNQQRVLELLREQKSQLEQSFINSGGKLFAGMDGWMDGWMNGWMNGWMDGWMDGWMNG